MRTALLWAINSE